ncbi:MarR family transcriptional regulator [Roseobacter denitrificans]|uniref:Multiple antibiotic resistance protein MarR n=1 Tax=Roseobacter denitrificans (strain ATCC 33942 / OCh 114) TaxID=375451 RepID=Q16A30_ROSDO|nr:MarR family transcriptional regulator [Roseobacter denitrificans]ABG31163.1 multiple antibiotic resistance protein MarR [Roseobacter denitrificans OCh 114]AVL54224.1 MarR family transcriptional regulator [Roseobacter denitrificans]SFG32078.1 DNA-binding transcriptional regulator, MarR family [Roseobacter denitrificans OCh 114]
MPVSREHKTARTQPYRLDEQVGYLLRLATQRHAHILQEHLPHELTPTQFAALMRLAELGTCSQNELGRQIAVDAATIKGVVDRLRKKGFVETHPDAGDKRRLMLSLVSGLDDMIAALHETGFHISERTLDPLDPDERAEFVRLLKKAAFADHSGG